MLLKQIYVREGKGTINEMEIHRRACHLNGRNRPLISVDSFLESLSIKLQMHVGSV